MISALIWESMRAILTFIHCEGQSHNTVSINHNLFMEEYFSELRSCVKVEVAVMGSPFTIVPTVSVDVKQHFKKKT